MTAVGVRYASVMTVSVCVLTATAGPIRAQDITFGPTVAIHSRGHAGADGPMFDSKSRSRSANGAVDISGSRRVPGDRGGAAGRRAEIPGDMQAYAAMAHPSVVAHRAAAGERDAQERLATEARISDARREVADLTRPLAAALSAGRPLAGRPGTMVPSYRRGAVRGSRGSGQAPDIGGLLGAFADQVALYREGRENRRMNEALDEFARGISVGTVVQVKILFVNGEYRSVYPADRQVWLGDGFEEVGPFTIKGTKSAGGGCGGSRPGPVDARPGAALRSCR